MTSTHSSSRRYKAHNGPPGLAVQENGRARMLFSDQDICNDIIPTIPKLHAAILSDTPHSRQWRRTKTGTGVDEYVLQPEEGSKSDLDIVHAVLVKTELNCHLNEVLNVLITQESIEYHSTMKSLVGNKFQRGDVLFQQACHFTPQPSNLAEKNDANPQQVLIGVQMATLRAGRGLRIKRKHRRTQKLCFETCTHRYTDTSRAVHIIKTLPKQVHDQVVSSTHRSALRNEVDHLSVGFDIEATQRPGGSIHQTTSIIAHGYASVTPSVNYGQLGHVHLSPENAEEFARRRQKMINPEAKRVINLLTRSVRRFERVIRRRRFGFQAFIYFPTFAEDSSVMRACLVCQKRFGMLRREYFCQLCGHMTCNECSQLYEVEPRVGEIRQNRACLQCVVRVDSCVFEDEDLIAAMGPTVVEDSDSDWWSETMETSSMTSENSSASELSDQLNSADPLSRSIALETLGRIVGASNKIKHLRSTTSGNPQSKQKIQMDVERHVNRELRQTQSRYRPQDFVVAELERDYVLEFDKSRTKYVEHPLPPRPEEDKENARLHYIKESGVLESDYDHSALDMLAELAAKKMNCPIGFVSMVDDKNFHSVGTFPQRNFGLVNPRDESLCSHTVYEDKPLIIKNGQRDVRFSHMPVIKDFGVRFYAGFPIRAPDGSIVASLCASDRVPHDHITTKEYASMEALAKIASQLVVPQGTAQPPPPRQNTSVDNRDSSYTQQESLTTPIPVAIKKLPTGHNAGIDCMIEAAHHHFAPESSINHSQPSQRCKSPPRSSRSDSSPSPRSPSTTSLRLGRDMTNSSISLQDHMESFPLVPLPIISQLSLGDLIKCEQGLIELLQSLAKGADAPEQDVPLAKYATRQLSLVQRHMEQARARERVLQLLNGGVDDSLSLTPLVTRPAPSTVGSSSSVPIFLQTDPLAGKFCPKPQMPNSILTSARTSKPNPSLLSAASSTAPPTINNSDNTNDFAWQHAKNKKAAIEKAKAMIKANKQTPVPVISTQFVIVSGEHSNNKKRRRQRTKTKEEETQAKAKKLEQERERRRHAAYQRLLARQELQAKRKEQQRKKKSENQKEKPNAIMSGGICDRTATTTYDGSSDESDESEVSNCSESDEANEKAIMALEVKTQEEVDEEEEEEEEEEDGDNDREHDAFKQDERVEAMKPEESTEHDSNKDVDQMHLNAYGQDELSVATTATSDKVDIALRQSEVVNQESSSEKSFNTGVNDHPEVDEENIDADGGSELEGRVIEDQTTGLEFQCSETQTQEKDIARDLQQFIASRTAAKLKQLELEKQAGLHIKCLPSVFNGDPPVVVPTKPSLEPPVAAASLSSTLFSIDLLHSNTKSECELKFSLDDEDDNAVGNAGSNNANDGQETEPPLPISRMSPLTEHVGKIVRTMSHEEVEKMNHASPIPRSPSREYRDYRSYFSNFHCILTSVYEQRLSSGLSSSSSRESLTVQNPQKDQTLRLQLKLYESWQSIMHDYTTIFGGNIATPSCIAPRSSPSTAHYRINSTTRKEVCDIVIHAIEQLNDDWEEHPSGLGLKTTWNLLWTWSKPRVERKSLLTWQKVNHFQHAKALTRKDCLKKNIGKYLAMGGKMKQAYEIIPLTFILPQEYVAFVQAFHDRGAKLAHRNLSPSKNIWIMKPVALSRGRGISLVNDFSQVIYGEQVVIQEYIANPLLLDGFKFDLRLYVLVTSFNPLEAFFYEEGFMRMCTRQYEDADLTNLFVHLTNSSIQKENQDAIQASTNPINAADQDEAGGTKMTLAYLWKRLEMMGANVETVKNDIITVILKSLLCGEDHIPFQVNSFDLLGYDILLDDTFRPWLIEINASPSMARENDLDYQIKDALILDTIKLVNPLHFDRAKLVDVIKRRLNDMEAEKKRPHAHIRHPKGAEELAIRQLNEDLTDILHGQVPRSYGDMPSYVGKYRRISPHNSIYNQKVKKADKVKAKSLWPCEFECCGPFFQPMMLRIDNVFAQEPAND